MGQEEGGGARDEARDGTVISPDSPGLEGRASLLGPANRALRQPSGRRPATAGWSRILIKGGRVVPGSARAAGPWSR